MEIRSQNYAIYRQSIPNGGQMLVQRFKQEILINGKRPICI